MQTTVSVFPVQGGWVVESDGVEPLFFASGGMAETYARKLVELASRAGHTVRLVIRDLNGRLVRPAARRGPA